MSPAVPASRRAAVAAVFALALAGCTGDEGTSVEAQMRQGDQKGYVAGDGTIQALDAADRTTVITLEGTTLEGTAWSSTDRREEVVVVNVWGSWCAPCAAEAADLEEVASAYAEADAPVQFVGVNDRDGVETALAFQRKYDVSYPSLRFDGGRTLTQLQGLATPRPTTLVLDGQGRLAARVSGQVDASTLRGLVDDVLADEATG